MAFKMKGWSPFDKKDKAKTTMYNKGGVSIDEVYKALDKGGFGIFEESGGFSAKELAAMTEKERAGLINDYEPGDFDKMVQEMKEKLVKKENK